MNGLEGTIQALMEPVAALLTTVVFYAVPIGPAQVPLVVVWLLVAALFFTLRFRFVNVTGFREAVRLVAKPAGTGPGEVSHFQALSTAVSGTVGIGNIGGVAAAISLGGPGAAFWMVFAGVLGMSTKFVECTLGVRYREEHADGTVSGGPMYYLERGLAERGWARLGSGLGRFYALGIVLGCLGIGNMFQSNQAYQQLLAVSGGPEHSFLAGRGFLVGLPLAFLVGLVIVGGVRSIARVTEKLVPFMALLYLIGAAVMLVMNAEALPHAFRAIRDGAFAPEGIAGGALGVVVIGFQRALFSNEAGLGSATIAHAAVRTDRPATEGLVAVLEPFLDTIVICSATALVVITTQYYEPGFGEGLGGIELTSAAFARNLPWTPYVLSVVAILFAVSTMISWSYYGLKGFTYLVGRSPAAENAFRLVFCAFVVLGCMVELRAVLDISDALVFLICVPNVFGLYLLAPVVREELAAYWNDRGRSASGAG